MILKPILLSIKVAFIATTFTLILGIFLARLFTKYDFKLKEFLEVFILLPMVLPPSVIGYGLLILIGRRGIIGSFLLNTFGITLVFHWVAACIAAIVVSLPLMYQSCKAGFQGIEPSHENAARTLGATELTVFWKISLPTAWPGILSGIILSLARSIGEFGATLMVAGNIPGRTQTIPLAIFFAVDSGNTKVANILMMVTVAFSFLILYSLNTWIKKRTNYTDRVI